MSKAKNRAELRCIKCGTVDDIKLIRTEEDADGYNQPVNTFFWRCDCGHTFRTQVRIV